MEHLPLIGIGYVIAVSLPLAIIDFREHRLPNYFTLSAIAVNALVVIAAGFLTGEYPRLLVTLAIGGATLGLGYLMAHLNGIGMGDVKLLTAINTSVGWFSPLAVMVLLAIGFTLASLVSLGLILFRKANLKTPIAMGPFLLIGFGYVSLEIIQGSITAVVGS